MSNNNEGNGLFYFLAGTAFGAVCAAKELLGQEEELLELREEGGIEKQRAGGFQSAGKMSSFCPVGNRVVNQFEISFSVSGLIRPVDKG